MEKGKRIYSREEVKCLKRCLLGFCGSEAMKSQEKLYKAIRKAEIAHSDYSDDTIREAAEHLIELSRNKGLTYRVSTDAEFLSDEPDNIFNHKLYIQKRGNDLYKVFTLKKQSPTWSPLNSF